MAEETNKALLRRFVEELVNQGNMAVAPELVAPDFIELDPFPGQAPGRAGLIESIERLRRSSASSSRLRASLSFPRRAIPSTVYHDSLFLRLINWPSTGRRLLASGSLSKVLYVVARARSSGRSVATRAGPAPQTTPTWVCTAARSRSTASSGRPRSDRRREGETNGEAGQEHSP